MLNDNAVHTFRTQKHCRMFAKISTAEFLVPTEEDHSKQLICWKGMIAFVFALFVLSQLWIVVVEFLRLMVRRQALTYQARFEVKKTKMGKKGVCKEDSCSWEPLGCQVMRGSLY